MSRPIGYMSSCLFKATATSEIYTLSLHDALPIFADRELVLTRVLNVPADKLFKCWTTPERMNEWFCPKPWTVDRKSTRLNSSHMSISYAVFCLKNSI